MPPLPSSMRWRDCGKATRALIWKYDAPLPGGSMAGALAAENSAARVDSTALLPTIATSLKLLTEPLASGVSSSANTHNTHARKYIVVANLESTSNKSILFSLVVEFYGKKRRKKKNNQIFQPEVNPF